MNKIFHVARGGLRREREPTKLLVAGEERVPRSAIEHAAVGQLAPFKADERRQFSLA